MTDLRKGKSSDIHRKIDERIKGRTLRPHGCNLVSKGDYGPDERATKNNQRTPPGDERQTGSVLGLRILPNGRFLQLVATATRDQGRLFAVQVKCEISLGDGMKPNRKAFRAPHIASRRR